MVKKDLKLGHSFIFLNTTQFLGALNDNIFKLLIIMFLIGSSGSEEASRISAKAQILFVIPFLLFSALAGKMADRFSKRNIVVAAKIAEVVIMVVAFVAFLQNNTPALYVALFVMATQSAFFGPAKYSIVPELVEDHQLSRANSFLEGCTYLAIVLGMAAAILLVRFAAGNYAVASIFCIVLAIVGVSTSFVIAKTVPRGVKQKASILFWREIWRTLRSIRGDKGLLYAVITSAYFMLIGGFIQVSLIPYGMDVLGFSQVQGAGLFVCTAIGIGVGAFWSGKLSGRNIEFGIIPLGALGLTVTAAVLAVCPGDKYIIFTTLFIMGVSAGLFIVPIHAFIQFKSPDDQRGRILAASNFLGWAGVLLAGGLVFVLTQLPFFSARMTFGLLSVITVILTLTTIKLLPDFVVRFFVVMLTRLCYRIKVVDPENVPVKGGAMLVSNHVSWADALLVAATQQRRVRFMMDREIYNNKWLNPLFKLMQIIPISATDPPKQIVASLKQARTALDEGYLLCVFAEGTITRNGMMRAFKGGFERIIRGSGHPIIPTYIGGAWGSILSYYYGRILKTAPRKFPYPVSIHFGDPLPADSKSDQVKLAVHELSCQYYEELKPTRKSLGHTFILAARKHWKKHAISDPTGKRLSYGRMLTSAVAIGDQINKLTRRKEKVGLLLPSSVAGALCNMAVTINDRIAVNLNYTVSPQARAYAIKQCEIKTIISSRAFLEKLGIAEELPDVIFIEDIKAKITSLAKVKAYLKARLTPARYLARARKFNADDLVTVIFSSGSSGHPKGIMLSHHNIISNIEAVRMVIHLMPDDHLCSLPPFFHSLGYTAALWMPMLSGISAHFVPNPLDGKLVGKGARENRSTILFAPPTFLLSYLRRAEPEDFATMRLVVAGAEKLKQRLADSFEAKFGIRPLEGYGTTEMSPVTSLNVPDVIVTGISHIGNKPGTIGHPIPGVAVKVVDIETGDILPIGTPGLLMAKGPNLMLGYLNNEEETQKVIRDGWYDTGDIAKLDEEDFITITDRLSRFSKIAGEMVPHGAVEHVLLHALETSEQVVAVTGAPDPKKGEQLVVLYTDKAATPEKLYQILSDSDLPNIFKPRKENFIKIDTMPMLGTGKLDILKLRQIAAEKETPNQ